MVFGRKEARNDAFGKKNSTKSDRNHVDTCKLIIATICQPLGTNCLSMCVLKLNGANREEEHYKKR